MGAVDAASRSQLDARNCPFLLGPWRTLAAGRGLAPAERFNHKVAVGCRKVAVGYRLGAAESVLEIVDGVVKPEGKRGRF